MSRWTLHGIFMTQLMRVDIDKVVRRVLLYCCRCRRRRFIFHISPFFKVRVSLLVGDWLVFRCSFLILFRLRLSPEVNNTE